MGSPKVRQRLMYGKDSYDILTDGSELLSYNQVWILSCLGQEKCECGRYNFTFCRYLTSNLTILIGRDEQNTHHITDTSLGLSSGQPSNRSDANSHLPTQVVSS